jgi:hypothetical protein
MIYLNLFVALFMGYRLVNVEYSSKFSRNIDGFVFAFNLADVLLFVDKIVQSVA